jgi:hypothetical protein
MHRNKLTWTVLVFAAAGTMWACGDDDDGGPGGAGSGGKGGATAAGAGGRAGGTAQAGSSGTLQGGSGGDSGNAGEGGAPVAGAGGDSAGGDSAGGSAGESSQAGAGGEAGSASVPTLAENCATVCEAQAGLTACTFGNTCVPGCVGLAGDTEAKSEYTAMIACEAEHLTANQYVCSDQGPESWPAPVPGTECETAICAWTCADQTFVDVNIYERCGCT